MATFVSTWVPIIAAFGGAFVGSIGSGIGSAAGPVVKDWLKERLFGQRDNLLDFMNTQITWFRERESKLNVFAFELSRDPAPDVYRRQIPVAQLDHHDRPGAMPFVLNDSDMGKLKEWQSGKRRSAERMPSRLRDTLNRLTTKRCFGSRGEPFQFRLCFARAKSNP